jgi:DNA modification methylase
MTPISYLETGVIYCDDNLHRLSEFPAECVDLIYLDPPFFSNRQYEVIWGDEAEVRSFEDRWEGGIHVYVQWMKERMIEMHRVLRPTGCLYLHCDWHASHYLKVMMDDVFGIQNFQNEVIWHYRGGGVSPSRWGRRHDTLLFYSKGKTWTFNVDPVRTEYSASVMESLPSRYDKSYRGERVYSGYRPNPLGKHPDDVWDVQPIMPSAKERLGYPTQKPETLLTRVILSSSNTGDVVLDPFAGCGTSLVVAHQLGRQWIGVDISPTAVTLAKHRMSKVGAKGIKLVGMPVSEEQLHALKPFEFQNWVIQRFNGTHSPRQSGDMGIDGYSFMEHLPIQVKQSERVGRNVVDNFETAVERGNKHRGYIVAFSFTRGAHEEAARAKESKGLEITLVGVADLLAETTELVTPDAGQFFPAEAPLPKARPAESRPSVEQLIKSDQARD